MPNTTKYRSTVVDCDNRGTPFKLTGSTRIPSNADELEAKLAGNPFVALMRAMARQFEPHYHKCPQPSCGHVWQHQQRPDTSEAEFQQMHTCPMCKVGQETWKCDAQGNPT